MMRRLCFLVMVLMASAWAGKVYAQTENRTSFYLGAGLEKEFSKKLSAGFDLEGRFGLTKTVQELLMTPYVEYSPWKFISAGVEYRVAMEHEADKEMDWSGRLGAYMKAKVSPANFKLECRIKYCNYTEDWEDGSTIQYFRTKFGASYKLKPLKLTPYMSYEWFYNISRGLVDKDRFVIGLKKKLDKHNSIGMEYMFEEKFNRGKTKHDINNHILAVNYQFTLPAAKKEAKKNDALKENK